MYFAAWLRDLTLHLTREEGLRYQIILVVGSEPQLWRKTRRDQTPLNNCPGPKVFSEWFSLDAVKTQTRDINE